MHFIGLLHAVGKQTTWLYKLLYICIWFPLHFTSNSHIYRLKCVWILAADIKNLLNYIKILVIMILK